MTKTFRTVYKPVSRELRLSPQYPVALVGSCFSDNIGSRFRGCGWNAAVNPCGVLFNPISILRTLRNALDGNEPEVETLGDRWISWDFSTLFSDSTEEGCRRKCRDALHALASTLSTPGATLIVTFGTAFVYHLQRDGRPVANCHKAPAADFLRWMVSADDIATIWTPMVADLMTRGINVIFTVSPVRHVKDGLDGNSLSKAMLRVACAKICAATGATYFPAYEIINDDLRDYRFYAADMVHPSDVAADYVWDIFQKEFMDETTVKALEEASGLIRRLAHRHINPDDPRNQHFTLETNRLIDDFKKRNPWFQP